MILQANQITKKYDWAIFSGFFNPLTAGHVKVMEHCKAYIAEKLYVIVNSDKQVQQKQSTPFYDEIDRAHIVSSCRFVDSYTVALDNSIDVSGTIAGINKYLRFKISPSICFIQGTDYNESNLNKNEVEMCEKLGINIILGVGPSKQWSSSKFIRSAVKIYLARYISSLD